MDILKELQTEAMGNRIRTERMAVVMTAILKKVIKLEKAEDGSPKEVSGMTETVVPLLKLEQQEESSRIEEGDNSNRKE